MMLSGRLARSAIMVDGVVVRPDQVSLGVLVAAVPRDAVDDAVAGCGVGANARTGSCRRMWRRI